MNKSSVNLEDRCAKRLHPGSRYRVWGKLGMLERHRDVGGGRIDFRPVIAGDAVGAAGERTKGSLRIQRIQPLILHPQ